MSRRIEVKISREDHKAVSGILRAGTQKVRVVLRALALEQLTSGQSPLAVARIVHLSPFTVRRIAHRYCRDGLEGALFDRPGRGAKAMLQSPQEEQIIAMVCSQPPPGRRWSVRLVAAEAMKRKLVPHVSPETIRGLLGKYNLRLFR